VRILITGGAGFIGSHLVDELVRRGSGEIVVVDDFSHGYISNLRDSLRVVSIVSIDVTKDSLAAAMKGVDVVYHLAAIANVRTALRNPTRCMITNIIGTVKVLKAAEDAGVRRLVFASSREVYGDALTFPVPEDAPLKPRNVYGVTKAVGELCCAESGLPVAILRLANVYGTRDRGRVVPTFIENSLTQRPLVIYGGRQVIDFVQVETVVTAFLKAGLEQFVPGPINIGSGFGTTIADLALRIRSLTGSSSELQFLPPNRAEVSNFVADTRKGFKYFQIPTPSDPLGGLSQVLESMADPDGSIFALANMDRD
jgi:UDP-glucose 4-epimerase